METKDYFTSILLGFLSGVWISFFYYWLRRLKSFGRYPKFAMLLFIPGLVWFVFVYGILFWFGPHIPDWMGMKMLVSGVTVFLISVVTTATSFVTNMVIPVYCAAILGATILNLIFVVLRNFTN